MSDTTLEFNIDSQMQILRELVHKADRVGYIFDDSIWPQLLSSLDVIEDTQAAINYYIRSDYPTDYGGQYLYVYGLLQALFMQQDAIDAFCDIVFGKVKRYDIKKWLSRIRDFRNDIVGHPTNRCSKYFIRLVRCEMQKNTLSYTVTDKSDNGSYGAVDIPLILQDQQSCVSFILSKIEQELSRLII